MNAAASWSSKTSIRLLKPPQMTSGSGKRITVSKYLGNSERNRCTVIGSDAEYGGR